VRFCDYMLFRHCYDWINNHNNSSLNMNLYALSKRFSSWYKMNGKIVCIDYSKFDAHLSNIDVYFIKREFAKRTPITDMHLDRERFDYPLYYANNDIPIVDFANKLSSGDYLTSFIGTFFQLSTYDMINKEIPLLDYVCGGDDAALLVNDFSEDMIRRKFNLTGNYKSKADIMNHALVEWFKKNTGDEVASDKSRIDAVGYNRRIWCDECYPFNNMFTLVNAMFRREKMDIERSVPKMHERTYDIYLAWIALLVRARWIGATVDSLSIVVNTLNRQCNTNMNLLHFKDVIQRREYSKPHHYPGIESVVHLLKNQTESTLFNDIYGDSVENILRRYATNPHADSIEPRWYTSRSEYTIDITRYQLFMHHGYDRMPHWMRENFYNLSAYNELGVHYTLFADVLAKFNMGIVQTDGIYKFDNSTQLADCIAHYIATVFPKTAKIK